MIGVTDPEVLIALSVFIKLVYCCVILSIMQLVIIIYANNNATSVNHISARLDDILLSHAKI